VSFAAINLCVASQRVFVVVVVVVVVVVCFVIDSVWKFLDTPSDVFDMRILILLARFEVFMAVKTHVEALWIVTPCIVAAGYRRFGRPCCLHI
jgi:hypothetical protein